MKRRISAVVVSSVVRLWNQGGCNYWGFSARGGLIDFRVAIAVTASRELETVYGCIY